MDRVAGSILTEDHEPISPARCPTCRRALPLPADVQETVRRRLGRLLREARIEAGMTQEEVAENCDPPLSRVTITFIENGQQGTELGRLIMICSVIGVDWQALLEAL